MGVDLAYQYEIADIIRRYTATNDRDILTECSREMLVGIIITLMQQYGDRK